MPCTGYNFPSVCKIQRMSGGILPVQDGCDEVRARNLKQGTRSLFDPCVNAMGWWPYCLSRREASHCIFRFSAGAITHLYM